MRKISRGGKPIRKSGSGRADRSTKPGFRPKGNNSGSVRTTRRSEDSEDAPRERRPRSGQGSGYRSGDSRSSDRPSRREERPSRPGTSGRSSSGSGSFGRSSSGERSERSSSRSGSGFSRRPSEGRPDKRASGGVSRRSPDERPSRSSGSFSRRSSDDRTARGSSRSSEGFSRRTSDERPPRRTSDERTERKSSSPSRSFTKKTEESRGSSRGSSDRPLRGSDRREKSFSRDRRSTGRKDFSRKPFRRNTKNETASENSGQTRLNKFIANCGICSRREADDLIKAGVISVNGHVITEMGYKVNQGDEVRYNNEILRGERPVYLLLNKPKDYITTVDDPGQRHTVMELVAGACKERIYPVGRLDRNTTGVLLFTNDGDLARKLMHPSFHVQKIYHVSLDGALKPDEMDRIMEGIHLEDGPIQADDIAYAGEGNDRKEIGIELHSGRNRIVRRIFEFFGHEVVKLDRTVFAGLTKKDLPRGRWRFLTAMEVNQLKMQAGDKKLRGASVTEFNQIED
ncbi:MAG: pseudouridine synthase [Bacteroidota bacterium]